MLAENLGVHFTTVPIEAAHGALEKTLAPLFAGTAPGLAEENMQARLRGNILMSLSNKFGHMLLTTGNKSELATGYCTLYGDMCGGLALISDVPKMMVRASWARLHQRAGGGCGEGGADTGEFNHQAAECGVAAESEGSGLAAGV